MSWVLASFLVLGLALTAGFGWYERSHPSARVLALVATLAALAALGRIAFAPLPSVKPTTDIVLLTGYVLGGAPGFAVGAVAALASNLFFGQGPWTPWQMVGWGGAGLFGAALAQLGGRELGRLALAAACAAAGLAFGAVMNLSLWVTYSGDHTLAKLGAVFATSLPFDVAHALGNAAFCLAFGPALVRALRRFRTRFEVTWRPAPAAAGRRGGAAGARRRAAVPSRARAASRRGRSPTSSARRTATAGSGPRPARARRRCTRAGPRSGSPPPGATRATSSAAGATSSTTSAPTRRRSGATSASARARSSRCAPRASRRRARAAATCSGSCCGRRRTTARSPAASTRPRSRSSRCARRAAPRAARAVRAGAALHRRPGQRRRRLQLRRQGRRRPGADDTGAALQALAAAGPPPLGGRAARGRLARAPQNADGGFALQSGPSNAQSTAWAVQGLIAAGRKPARVRRGGSRSPLGYLRSLVTPSGAIRYSRTSAQTPVWVTAQALTALARQAVPAAPGAARTRPRARRPRRRRPRRRTRPRRPRREPRAKPKAAARASRTGSPPPAPPPDDRRRDPARARPTPRAPATARGCWRGSGSPIRLPAGRGPPRRAGGRRSGSRRPGPSRRDGTRR